MPKISFLGGLEVVEKFPGTEDLVLQLHVPCLALHIFQQQKSISNTFFKTPY